MSPDSKYTCSDYRAEMRLLGLKKKLHEKKLSPAQIAEIQAEIDKLEKILQMN
jgi:hypothetical protein